MFFFGQVCATLALIFSVISLQGKNKNTILLFQIPADLFYCFSYLSLGSYVGFLGVFIATIRTIIFFYYNKKLLKPSVFWLTFFCILTVLCGAFSFKGIYDILPVIGLVAFTYATWQKNENTLIVGAIILSVCLLIYNIIIGLYISAVQESILILSAIFAMYKFNKAQLN